tara:strand:- start:36 stop:704 length:669 start_codon:yes stop_codon:yes gene_type:complete
MYNHLLSDFTYAFNIFITNIVVRWFFYFITLFLTILAFIQEPVRYSYLKGFTGLSYKWHMYLLAIFNLLNYIFTFLCLWYTIPFKQNALSGLWYLPIFAIVWAIYTEVTLNTNQTEEDGTFNPPPKFLYPKSQRLIIHWFILIFDIIIFLQFYLSSGITNINKDTYLHKLLLGRFGGYTTGNKLAFITSWLGLIGLANDFYNINIQSKFRACIYNLPKAWDF